MNRFRTICVCVLPAALASGASGAVTVGTGAGDMASVVSPLLTSAQTQLSFSTASSGTLDAAFFDSIDVFVFANAMGASEFSLGSTARANLVNFVATGGTAYLGLDVLQDGASIAADFGFTLVDRNQDTNNGVVSVTSNLIASGPFQPATSLVESWHGRFSGEAPSGGQFLASTAHGAALAYREIGAGRVYLFSDEVPLIASGVMDHQNMFNNVLFAAGAPLVPSPSAAIPFAVAGVATLRRRRAASFE